MRLIRSREIGRLLGQELGTSEWLVIDQGMIDRFAEVTGDHQWIHVDTQRAAREGRTTIAHGFLVLSLLARLSTEICGFPDFPAGLNYGFNKIRFTGPVPVGSAIRLREILVSAETRDRGVLLTRDCEVQVRDAERPALRGDWLTLLLH